MKVDLISIWQGALDIEIKGSSAERFLNLAYLEGIELQNINHQGDKIYARVPLRRVKELRKISRNSGASFHIQKRIGAPFYNDFFKRRPVLAIMIAIAVFLFFFISSLVFTLDVSGPYKVSEEDQQKVLELAAEAGVESGSSRWGVDMDVVEAYILSNFDELVFAQIQENGVHLTINVVKRVDVSEDDSILAPGNLVASCDGIIEDILVLVGQAAVDSGDAVKKDDVLIYGIQGDQKVAAKGLVTAMIWQDGYGECAMQEKSMQPTGEQAISLGLSIENGPYFNIAGANLDIYEHYQVSDEVIKAIQWRKHGPSVEVIQRKIYQMQVVIDTYTQQEARIKAEDRAKENARSNIIDLFGENKPKNFKIINETIEDIDISVDLARAYAIYQCQIKIGIYKPLKKD